MSVQDMIDTWSLPTAQPCIEAALNQLIRRVRDKGYTNGTVDLNVWTYSGGDRTWNFIGSAEKFGERIASASGPSLKEAAEAMIVAIDAMAWAPDVLSPEAHRELVDGLDRIMRDHGRAVARRELERVVSMGVGAASIPTPEKAA
jgi:hypothetical protein